MAGCGSCGVAVKVPPLQVPSGVTRENPVEPMGKYPSPIVQSGANEPLYVALCPKVSVSLLLTSWA